MGTLMSICLSLCWLSSLSECLDFPAYHDSMTTLRSKFHPNVAISYKESDICESTTGVRSFSGYIHLPPNSFNETGEDQDYPINMKNPQTAPLALWLNGGPGGSSAAGIFVENGPCFVNDDSNSTRLNPWSWNNEVNMLYIDQPVQVGYSFDTRTNITVDTSNALHQRAKISVADFTDGIPEQNNTFYTGVSSSQLVSSVTNSTNHSAVAFWHFAQAWFDEFPHYKPLHGKISIWTESYGGHYGPAFARYFNQQNKLIADSAIYEGDRHIIHLDTLGLINACVDDLVQGTAYLDFAHRNTYGIEVINSSVYALAMQEWAKHGGVRDLISECQSTARKLDPHDYGNHPKVNEACIAASEAIETYLINPYRDLDNHGQYDVAHPAKDPFPAPYWEGYLNQPHVQHGLGAAINHTSRSTPVYKAFDGTGDLSRGGYLDDIAYVLKNGVRVAMVYGDRDFICNWIGGERASLAIPHDKQDDFIQAGYEPINVNSSYVGGLVRQHANLSFARVFQAGHMVPSYQPETSYRIFMRTIFGKDVATGIKPVTNDLSTEGPSSTWHVRQQPPVPPQPKCYILVPSSCSEDQWEAVKNGSAIIEDYIFKSFGHENPSGVDEQTFEGYYEMTEGSQKILLSPEVN